MITPGSRNLITDVPSLLVGNADDPTLKSGVTVLTSDRPFTAAVNVMGGAPGTRETDLLAPDKLVQQVDALVLSGGSAFGLDAASGAMDALRVAGRGFAVGSQTVPIVPAAILFDLINGGDKNWSGTPYRDMGAEAFRNSSVAFDIGTAGAGTGARIADLKGGLGSASAKLGPYTIGALVAVNALGRVTMGEGKHFWAAPFELENEFGGHGLGQIDPTALPPTKSHAQQNTTIAIVATDAALSQAQATRMAAAAQDGMARAIYPSHTPMDGDLVFAVSTGSVPLADPTRDPAFIGHIAATTLSRAIARGVYAATPALGDIAPTYQQRFGA